MRLAVIFIATAFEVRLKNKQGAFLKQHERFRMAGMLDEITRWVSESVHSPEITVITCYDEIYEICIRRHVKAVKNEFGSISEGNMIRAGMLAMPGHETYLVISASEPRLIKAELFENLCGLYISQSGKTSVTKYKGKLQLPIVFSIKNTDPVNSMLDKDKGKFVLRSGQKNTVFFEVSEEFLGSPDRDRRIKDYLSGASAGLTGEEENADVVVIRGGGRVGTGIAVALFEAGKYVLITEKDEPDTIFRGMSFACAVKDSEMTVNGVTGYLVAPGMKQFDKAWKAGVIPVVIDPDFSCVGLFGTQNKAESLFDFGAFKDDEVKKKYELKAVIDCTSHDSGVAFPEETDILTIGLKNNNYLTAGPKYLIDTSFSPRYATVYLNRDIKVVRVDVKDQSQDISQDSPKDLLQPPEIFHSIKSPADGRFREIKRIGDYVKANDLIAQIAVPSGDRTDILSGVSGRITGNFADNGLCLAGDIICAIDLSATSAEDCFAQSPMGMLPGISVRKLIDGASV